MLNNSLNTSAYENQDFVITVCMDNHAVLCLGLNNAALNLLLLPLYLKVVYVGFQQYSTISSIGNSDVFTYNLALIEIIGAFGVITFTVGIWTKSLPAMNSSFCLMIATYVGQTLFHCLICFDRYLAVVHPLTYRNLKEARVVRIRDVCIVLVWVFSLSWIAAVVNLFPDLPATDSFVFTVIFNIIVLYCCLSALYALTHPAPNGKKQVDQSKLRAFHIILTITCLLLLKLIGFLFYLCIYMFSQLKNDDLCLTLAISMQLIVPVNALIPLLFLYRMEKLTCFKVGITQ